MNECVGIGFAHESSVSTGVQIYGSIIEGIVCQVHSVCSTVLSSWSSCLPALTLHVLPSLDEALRIPRENTAQKLKKCMWVINIETEHAKTEHDCTGLQDQHELSWFTDDKPYLVYSVSPKYIETLVWCSVMSWNISSD